MSRRRTKAEAERIHLRRRALERYGRRFGPRTLAEWVQQIRSGRAVFLWRTSGTRTCWAVRYDGQWLPVVYNKTTGQIITVLEQWRLRDHQARLDAAAAGTPPTGARRTAAATVDQ
jgi:hypothetical protein